MGAEMLKGARATAERIAVIGMIVIFALFIYGVAMRHGFDRSQGWVDEAVTVLSAWLVFWTAAFVLRWPEFIAFDVVFRLLPPGGRRGLALAGALGFIGLIGAALWTIIDYTRFMRLSTTDMLGLRLDLVYAIFPIFLMVMLVRLGALCLRLIGPDWRAALQKLDPESDRSAP